MHLAIAATLIAAASAPAAERINQEGRILGTLPTVTSPIQFDTLQADAVVSAMQILPLTNPWNEDVSQLPLLTNSSAMINQIIADLQAISPTRLTLRPFYEMNYVLVPDNQTMVPITFFTYPAESDPSPYPIPSIMPVETWPVGTGTQTLSQWQQDVNNVGGDRHSCIVAPGAATLWETWRTRLVSGSWRASNGARFDLASNGLRTAGWTSGDAAGLPMFPALVRYDECQRGMVEHAMRIVVQHSRAEYLYPATHFASSPSTTNVDVPAMGQRVRLKAGFTAPSTWTIQEKAVVLGLKKYGALVADNGGFFSISVTPDDRYPSGCFNNLSSIGISNFEVVQSTGSTQGPRSPGAPTVDAGPDLTVASSATLNGAVSGSGVTSLWYPYPGAPGTVSFGSAGAAVTTATFSAPGNYTLMLRATDAVHAPAYDAVVVTVTAGTGTTSGSTSGTSGTTSTSGTTTASTTGSATSSGTGGTDPGGSGSGSCGVGGLAALLGTFAAWRRRRPG